MPLSDHEQRMLDQIESALYAEDPKFASSVRGGTLRAPSARRRLQGAALFVIGLAMLVRGVAFKATMIGSFPILSVIGFVLVLRVPKEEIHRAVRIHSLLVSSACCVITGFLWSWHLLALRLWAAL